MFAGRGQPPKPVSSSGEVKRRVALNAYAIGYLDQSAVDASVKVVAATE